MKHEVMRLFRWTMGFAVVVAGCGGGTDDQLFGYGEAEMQQVAVGDWTGTWTEPMGQPVALALQIRRPAAGGAQPLCTRQFAASGSTNAPSSQPLCIPASEMQLVGTLTTASGSVSNASLKGGLTTPGLELREGYLLLSSQAADLHLTAHWTENRWDSCEVKRTNGSTVAACTLDAHKDP